MANDSKNIGSIVERYSKALLELSIESKNMEEVQKDIQNIMDLIETSEDFRRVLKSPILSRNDQKQIIEKVFSKISISKMVLKFFIVVSTNRRSFIIDRICKRFLEMEKDYKGEVRAEIISTEAPEKDILFKIEKIIKDTIKSEVNLTYKIDKSIIGGYILNIGSVMLDGSIKSKLQGLRVLMKGTK